jgi:hypothetical protein
MNRIIKLANLDTFRLNGRPYLCACLDNQNINKNGKDDLSKLRDANGSAQRIWN